MKIALIGYGKMGKAIETIALSRGHEITVRIDLTTPSAWSEEALKTSDVAIEFTGPEAAPINLKKCFEMGLPVVCGSTGWLTKWQEVESACQETDGTLLYASNFSVGVNLFFILNEQLAKLMAQQPSYEITIEEIHHTEKKDAPSGTAITLAEQIVQQLPQKKGWANTETTDPDRIPIISKRMDQVPGTHRVEYRSEIDTIELTHTAHNRIGFATGAVLAAEFLAGKKGIYAMRDVLGMSR